MASMPANEMNASEAGTVEDQEMELKRINEEYKTWKKNSPFLYDMIYSTALEWPTLTTQWFPDVKDHPEKNHTVHRLLIGTHTSDKKPNYLQIAEVELPKNIIPNETDYDDETGEIGGYVNVFSGDSPSIKMSIIQKICHPGEVNKARYQPQNIEIIATMCVDGKVLVFDRTVHPRVSDAKPKGPQVELIGHQKGKEGYGLDWNPHLAGHLATGGTDNTVRLWDLNILKTKDTKTDETQTIEPYRTFTHHNGIVNDVQYHPIHRCFIGTASDDGTFQILDVRNIHNNSSVIQGTHTEYAADRKPYKSAVNAIAFHPTAVHNLATASASSSVLIWDIRMPTNPLSTAEHLSIAEQLNIDKQLNIDEPLDIPEPRNIPEPVNILKGHIDEVTSIAWHPNENAILGSGSYDHRIIFWDLARIGEEQLPDEQEDGPPELLFMHGGHTNHLSEFSWNKNEPWVVCSAAEDNLIQIWKVADAIVSKDLDDMPIEELER